MCETVVQQLTNVDEARTLEIEVNPLIIMKRQRWLSKPPFTKTFSYKKTLYNPNLTIAYQNSFET